MKIGNAVVIFVSAVMIISVVLENAVPIMQSVLIKNKITQIGITDERRSVNLKKGDCLYLGNYLGEPILWRVLDTKDGKPLMMTEHIICFKAFDANVKKTDCRTGTDTGKYGSSDWNECTLKEWLNSSEETVPYSHCPPYADEVGFLNEKNFNPHLRKLISEEGVFLLTTEEIKRYFTVEERKKTCTESSILHSNSPYLLTSSRNIWYWTSSPVSSNNVSVAAVTSSGGLYKTLACDPLTGVSPSVYLRDSSVFICGGEGSEIMPYIMM